MATSSSLQQWRAVSDTLSCVLKRTTTQLLSLSSEIVRFWGYGIPVVFHHNPHGTQIKVLLSHSLRMQTIHQFVFANNGLIHFFLKKKWIVYFWNFPFKTLVFIYLFISYLLIFYMPTRVSPPSFPPSSFPLPPPPTPATSIPPPLFLFRYGQASYGYQPAMVY